MNRTTFTITAIASAIVVALALAACGSPGGDEGNGDEEGNIVVAAAMPLTGPFASDGEEMERGLQMAVDDFNDDGGLLGREIEVVTCDITAMEVDTIQACGERLLGENPDAVITGYDGSVGTPTFGQGDMPYLHANTFRDAVQPVIEDPDQYSNVFQYDPSEIDYGFDSAERLPEIAAELGFEPGEDTIGVVTTDYAYNQVAADTFVEEMEALGYEVAVNEVTSFGVEEWGPILSRIQQAEPAFTTFWNLDPSDAARFMNQWDRQFPDGFDSLLYMQYTPSIPEFLELTGDSANGLLWSTVISPNDAVGEDPSAYTERYAERHGGVPRSIHPYVVRDAFEIWAGAVEEAGCARCFEEVNDNIRESEYSGFAGNYQFAPLEEGQYGLPGDELLPTIWSQVQGGENVVVLPENAAEGQMELPPWME